MSANATSPAPRPSRIPALRRRRHAGLAACLAAAAAAAASFAAAQDAADTTAPEAATEDAGAFAALGQPAKDALQTKREGRPTEAQDWMVAAANPLAVEAGAQVLQEGGSAADAMVATQAMLGLVEPQSSGLGGGAFLVYYDAATGTVTTLDGRETAPLAATPTLFQTEAGEEMEFFDAVPGGISVGTPGTPALMEAAHRRWGRTNWARLLRPAITTATEGFAVSPRLAGLVAETQEDLAMFPASAEYFLPNGAPIEEGAQLTNPAYAETLTALALAGADAFYTGPVAEGIVATVRDAENNPGILSLADLALYQVIERPAVCAPYRGHEVCGMGPPSSGALTVGQILGQLDNFDLAGMGPDSAEAWRLIGDASRLAFADRGLYMADSDFVPVPVAGLVDPAYLSGRAELLQGDDALPEVSPGDPEYDHALNWSAGYSPERPSTSHISIVDGDGNALAITTTIEQGFGSRMMAPGGFLLNNEITDFSFATHEDNHPIANAVAPGKRPRSSMSPTIVMQDGEPVLVVGSPGGSRIIGYVAKTIIAHMDWGMDVQAAVASPHLVNRFGTYDIEAGTDAEALQQPLSDMGFETEVRDLTSGLHAIAITPEGLRGGADPRREGIALGQ